MWIIIKNLAGILKKRNLKTNYKKYKHIFFMQINGILENKRNCCHSHCQKQNKIDKICLRRFCCSKKNYI